MPSLDGYASTINMSNNVKVSKKTSVRYSSVKYIVFALLICCTVSLFFSSSNYAIASQSTGHIPTPYVPPGMYSRDYSHIQYLGAMIDHGNVYISHGKYYEAITYFDKALKNDPSNFMALIGKGYALEKLQKYDDAISYLDRALKIYPNNAYAVLFKQDTLYGKALSLVSLGKYQEATIYYKMILKMNPKFDLSATDMNIIHKLSK